MHNVASWAERLHASASMRTAVFYGATLDSLSGAALAHRRPAVLACRLSAMLAWLLYATLVSAAIVTMVDPIANAGVADTLEAHLADARKRHADGKYRTIPLLIVELGIRSQWASEHPSRLVSPRLVRNEGGVDDEVDGGTRVSGNNGMKQRGVIKVDGGINRSQAQVQESIEPQLEVAGLKGFADGTVSIPPMDDVGLRREFRAAHLLTFMVISRCCSPVVQLALKICRERLDAGHQAWHFILSTYQVKDDLYIAQLEEKMTHIQMGEQESATDYCNRARRILAEMRMAGAEYSTASYISHIVKGLPHGYNLMKRMMMVPGTRESLDEDSITSYILQDEAMQEAEQPTELFPQVNYAAPTKLNQQQGQRRKPSGGGRSTDNVDEKRSTRDKGRGSGGRRRECWICHDPDHLSYECPDRDDSDEDDTKGGRGRSTSSRPRRDARPRKEKQTSKKPSSTKDVDNASGKSQGDGEASCSMVGVAEPTVLLAPEAGEDFQAVAAAVQANPMAVLLDSGCSHHLMGTKAVFVDIAPSNDVKHVRGFNGALQPIEGRGTIALQGEAGKRVLIPDVLYVPGIQANLLYAGKLKESEVQLQGDGDKMLLVAATGEVLGRARYNGRVLCTDLRPCSMRSSPTEVVALRRIVSATKSTPDRLHARLAHDSVDTIKSSAKHKVAIGLDITPSTGADPPCVSCVGGKLARHTFPDKGSDAEEALAVVHIDLCGPFRVAAKDGSLFFLLLKDRHTRFVWVMPVSKKSDVLREFQKWLRLTTPPGTTPYQLLTGKKPDLTLAQVWGCMVQFMVPEQQRGGKLAPKARWGLHLGVSPESKGWEVLDLTDNKVVTSVEVIFYETLLLQVWKAKFGPASGRTQAHPLTDTLTATVPLLAKVDAPADEDVVEVLPPPPVLAPRFPVADRPASTPVSVTGDEGSLEVSPVAPTSGIAGGQQGAKLADQDGKPSTTWVQSTEELPKSAGGEQLVEGSKKLVDDFAVDEEGELSAREESTDSNVVEVPITKPELRRTDPEHHLDIVTMTVKEALASWKGKAVKAAMEEEIRSLIGMDTWELVERPRGVNIMKNRWVLTTKYRLDDTVEHEKARLVVKGFTQVCGADYDETYSPLDMKNAFLQSKLDRVLYMYQPDYFDDGTGRVCKLLKSLYGLKQSPLLWYRALDGVLLGAGWKKSQVDEALYFKASDNGVTCWVLVYVDDLLAACSSPAMLKDLKQLLEDAFELREISPVVKYLGLEIVRDWPARKLWLHQEGYADKLRRRFIDEEQGGRVPKMPVSVDAYAELTFDDEEAQEHEEEEYQHKLGSGLTLRSDQHWSEVNRCLAYLADTCDTALEFGGGPESLELIGYLEADDMGDKQKQTSMSGYVFRFYHPTSRRVLLSQDVTFDESVPFYHAFPYRTAPLPPPPPLFLAPGPPPVDPLPPQGPAPLGVSQVDPLPGTLPVEVVVDSGVAGGAASGGVASGGAEPGGAEPGGTELDGAEPRGTESKGAESGGAESRGGASAGGPAGAGGSAVGGTGAGGTGATSFGGAGDTARARDPGVGDPGAGGTGTRGAGAGGARAGGTGAGGAGAGGTGAGDLELEALALEALELEELELETLALEVLDLEALVLEALDLDALALKALELEALELEALELEALELETLVLGVLELAVLVLSLPSSTGLTPSLLCPPPHRSQLQVQPDSPLPPPSTYAEQSDSFTERREPESRPASPVRAIRTRRCVPHRRPPPVPGTHVMAVRPSSVPLRNPLPSPLASSLPDVPDPESNLARAASPTAPRLLATVFTDPSFDSAPTSALLAELVDFAAACRLDYATSLVAESESECLLSVRGECALGTDVLEERQEDFECLAAAVPHLMAMLLAREGDPDAPDIPTLRSYAEAITVPPSGANIVDGMWIFRVKQPPVSPPFFKSRYVARGFGQRQGVDFFQTFSPTPKMTTLRVLLHVAAQRDYDLHSLDFSTAFLQGSMHEKIWLRCPPGFTWSTMLAALGFAPSTADPSLFLRTDTSLPLFYVLVYVDDFVFAIADTEALILVKSELQKRHTCTDLGEVRIYLGLQITRDTAWCTITLTQSHIVHQVLQRFGFRYSSPLSTPLRTGHSLSTPPSGEFVEPSGPYPELVGCLMYMRTCTRPDLAYPISILARYVALGRH
ncbi:unnamed protein product [Closterium sp. NIES-53]